HIRKPCEYDTCSRVPSRENSPDAPEPREPLPGALRVSRAPRTPPGALRVPPAREPRTERPPGHSASTPRAPGSAFFFSIPNLENVQKIDRTLEIHNKSNFD